SFQPAQRHAYIPIPLDSRPSSNFQIRIYDHRRFFMDAAIYGFLFFVVAIGYGFFLRSIWKKDNLRADREAGYREQIPLTVPYNPTLKSGDRLATTVYLGIRADRGTTETHVTHEAQRFAQSEVIQWALTFTR